MITLIQGRRTGVRMQKSIGNRHGHGQDAVAPLVSVASDHDRNLSAHLYSMRHSDRVYAPTTSREAAEVIMRNEAQKRFITNEVGVFVRWNGGTYTGSIKQVYRPGRYDIVYLGKTSNPVPEDVVNEMKRIQPERATLAAGDDLDLTGKGFVLGLVLDRLVKLSPEQEEYVKSAPELRVQVI